MSHDSQRPAGLGAITFDDTAAKNLQPDIYYTPSGTHNVYLQYKKRMHIPDITHGVATSKSESVGRTFESMRVTQVEQLLRDVKEEIYASNKNEPLAKSKIHGYQIPKDGFVYGKGFKQEDGNIAEVVNPTKGLAEETQEVRALYRKTHRDYNAGEQRNRGYNLPEAVTSDPHFRYGFKSAHITGTARDCLNWSVT